MRKQIKVGMLAGLFGIVLLASVAHAVPTLQLDIAGGVYDWSSKTIVATSSSFTLYALLNPNWANHTEWHVTCSSFSQPFPGYGNRKAEK